MVTAISPLDSTAEDNQTHERRIGKSSYWISTGYDQLAGATSWRLSVIKKPARASRANPPRHLIHLSPQNPLFTVEIDHQRFPLIIAKISTSRHGKIVLSGSRKIGSNLTLQLNWVATLTPSEEHGISSIRVDGRFRCTGIGKKLISVAVRVPLVIYRPELIPNTLPSVRGVSAAAVWSTLAETAIGMVITGENASQATLFDGALYSEIASIDSRNRTPVHMTIALRQARSASEAQQLLITEMAGSSDLSLPAVADSTTTLLAISQVNIEHLLDSKSCTPVGKERWYFRASGEFDYGPGYPYFSSEAAPALMRYSKYYANEAAERTAYLTARGVAADFAVIVGESGAEGNKGAFWDCAIGQPGSLEFTTFDHRAVYGIASNSRIAYALFEMFAECSDPLLRQAAINACQWLILKQTVAGYYDSPFIEASTGRFGEARPNLDGMLAIRPLVAAFRTTGNEVFIRSAWKIAEFARTRLVPDGQAPCLYGFGQETNCPVALSAAIHAILDLDAEAPKESLRRSLTMMADSLSLCQFDHSGHRCLNYDQAYSGALECASAALRLYTFTGGVKWLRLGCTLIKQASWSSQPNWRLADLTFQLLLSLGTMLPGATVDLQSMTVTISWSKYRPDSAASVYLDVRDSDHRSVDFIPLVCRETNQTLLLIFTGDSTMQVELIKRNQTFGKRIPVTDMVTNAPTTLDPLTHLLPSGLGRFAVIRLDP